MNVLMKTLTILDVIFIFSIVIVFWLVDKPLLGAKLFLLFGCFSNSFLGLSLNLYQSVNKSKTAILHKSNAKNEVVYIGQFICSIVVIVKLVYECLKENIYTFSLTSLTIILILTTIFIVLFKTNRKLNTQKNNNETDKEIQ